jgi:hypothetical protein
VPFLIRASSSHDGIVCPTTWSWRARRERVAYDRGTVSLPRVTASPHRRLPHPHPEPYHLAPLPAVVSSVKVLGNLQSLGDAKTEIVRLNDYQVSTCQGCERSLDRGEELCPLKDDRDVLIGKMLEADGVVFASPVYSF